MQTILNINNVTKFSLTAFFKSEIEAGNITGEHSPAVIANYILSLQFGLAVMARNEATLRALRALRALKALIKLFTAQFNPTRIEQGIHK